ncbi:MAG: flavodoxin family protein [Candidatus Methanofastidiosia archaeon]
MKILILYYSRGGNTRELAKAVAEGVKRGGGVPVLRSTDEVTKENFIACKGVIAGSPVYFGSMAWPLKKIFDDFVGIRREMEGKVGAAFSTAGNDTGGKETTIFSIVQALMIYGMIVMGDPFSAIGHYGVACVGMPEGKTIENARELGKRVVTVAKKLFE